MFWRKIGGRYWIKNFREHMEIKNNVTLGGLMKRFQRKYPKTSQGIRKSFIMSSLFFIMMTLIPGCSLPLQTSIKITVLDVTCFFTKMLEYNAFTSSPGDYLIKLNEILLMAMSNQIYDLAMIGRYFREMQQLVETQKKALKGSNYLDLLLYSEIVLQNIVRYSNRLLLQPQVKDHFVWVFHSMMEKSPKLKISQKQDSHIRMFYTIVQYILNFGTEEQIKSCLLSYSSALKGVDGREQSFMCLMARKAVNQQQFLNGLKKIYGDSEEEEVKELVLDIFQQLDGIYINGK